MRSKDIAMLAGVSVRTIRHYHSKGLMPEPERSSNGYREYTPADLVRLLRIKRLASLGFSLAQIAEMLEDLDSGSTDIQLGSRTLDALDALDEELVTKIESLQEQRRIIAQLKDGGLSPDMPLRFARIWQTLNQFKHVDELTVEMRVALNLVGHLYNDDELDELELVARALLDDAVSQNVSAMHERYLSLGPDASDDEIEHVVEESLELLEPLFESFQAGNRQNGQSSRDDILRSVADKTLNAAQLEATERIAQEIEARLQGSTSLHSERVDSDVTS